MDQNTKSKGDKLKIFILEDDGERMYHFNKMFVDHQVISTNNKEMGETIVNTVRFDVIFLDHDLGGMQMVSSDVENTGYQLCKHISNINNRTLVIVHSWNNVGAKRITDRLRGQHTGQVLYAPFGSSEFSNAVKQLLSK